MTWQKSNHRDPVYDVLNMSIWTEARRSAVLEDTVDAVALVGMSWSPGVRRAKGRAVADVG